MFSTLCSRFETMSDGHDLDKYRPKRCETCAHWRRVVAVVAPLPEHYKNTGTCWNFAPGHEARVHAYFGCERFAPWYTNN